MSLKCAEPSEKSIQEMLDSLYGEGVVLSEAGPVEVGTGFVYNYIDDDDNSVAVLVADSSLVANAGSAMMMVPAGAAAEAAETGDLSSMMLDCYYEVANILSRTLMDDNSVHLRLEKMYNPGENVNLIEQYSGECKQVSYNVQVPEYGDGNMTFFLT